STSLCSHPSIQPEGNFEWDFCGNEFAVRTNCRLALPLLHYLHCRLVETVTEPSDNTRMCDSAVESNDTLNENASRNLCSPGFLCVDGRRHVTASNTVIRGSVGFQLLEKDI